MRHADMVLGAVEGRYGLESPTTILAWSKETFGERDALTIAIRASKEVNELLIAVMYNESAQSIHEELGDCAIMLWQVAELLEVEPRPSIPQDATDNPSFWVLQLQDQVTRVLQYLYTSTGVKDSVGACITLHHALRLLETLADLYSVNLPEVVDTKMGVNRERLWLKALDGSYQHSEKTHAGSPLSP